MQISIASCLTFCCCCSSYICWCETANSHTLLHTQTSKVVDGVCNALGIFHGRQAIWNMMHRVNYASEQLRLNWFAWALKAAVHCSSWWIANNGCVSSVWDICFHPQNWIMRLIYIYAFGWWEQPWILLVLFRPLLWRPIPLSRVFNEWKMWWIDCTITTYRSCSHQNRLCNPVRRCRKVRARCSYHHRRPKNHPGTKARRCTAVASPCAPCSSACSSWRNLSNHMFAFQCRKTDRLGIG